MQNVTYSIRHVELAVENAYSVYIMEYYCSIIP